MPIPFAKQIVCGLAGLIFLAACASPPPPATATSVNTPTSANTAGPADTPTTTAPTPVTLAATDFKWSVDFVQSGQALTATANQVTLSRAAFTIRVQMPQPLPVKLNAMNTDQNFKALQPGFVLSQDCTLALCTGMDVAEDRLNPDRNLFVDPQLTHYLYYSGPQDHRWSRVSLAPQGAVLERDVVSLNDKPIAQYSGPALYLLFFVNYTNAGQIDPGELKKITLIFH